MTTASSTAPDVGEEAPDFELYTDQSERWTLSDHRGRPVVLLFFPGAFTSVCTNELNTVNNHLSEYGNAEVVGISTDSPFVLEEFRSVNELDYPLLSDHDAEVSEAYGAKYDDNFTPMNLDRISRRAAFVIDDEGVVRYREVLDDAGEQPDFDEVKSVLEDIRS